MFDEIYIWISIHPLIAVLLTVVLIAAIAITIFLILRERDEKQLNYVKETSKRYKALEVLNTSYNFHESLEPLYKKHWKVDSKRKFDRFNYEQKFTNEIADSLNRYKNLLKQARENYALKI